MTNHESDLQAQTRYAIGSKSNLPNYATNWDCFKDKHPQITADSKQNKGLESGDWAVVARKDWKERSRKLNNQQR